MARARRTNTEDIKVKADEVKWMINQPGQGRERFA